MPGFVFDADEVMTLLDWGDVREPWALSPLRSVPAFGASLHEDDPRFLALVAKGFLHKPPRARKWRVNSVLRGALDVAAHPDEAFRLEVAHDRNPGVAHARRGSFVTECTVGHRGLTKLHFPLARTDVVHLLLSGLSGDGDPGEPSDFHFVGTPEEAFVLSTVMREVREGAPRITMAALKARVVRDTDVPRYAAEFGLIAGWAFLERLRTDPRAIEAAAGSLMQSGFLELVGGAVQPSAVTREVLDTIPGAAFTLRRTAWDRRGVPASHAISAVRSGRHRLVFRVRRDGENTRFEWFDTDRTGLRTLVAALLAIPERLAS